MHTALRGHDWSTENGDSEQWPWQATQQFLLRFHPTHATI